MTIYACEKCNNIINEGKYCCVQCKRRASKQRKRAKKAKMTKHLKAYLERKSTIEFAPIECSSSCNSSWD